jgi:hypothetical protein
MNPANPQKRNAAEVKPPSAQPSPAHEPKSPDTAEHGPTGNNPPLDQRERIDRQARYLSERYSANCVAAMLSYIVNEPEAALIYIERFLKESGNPKDPVLRVLLEQMAMAHLRLAKLNVDASLAKSPENQKVLTSAAARLLDEVRKLALGIKAYREPAASKPYAVIQQQNVAHEQQVSYTQQTGPEAKESLEVRDHVNLTGDGGRIFANDEQQTQPTARKGRSAQPVEAAAPEP